MVQEMVIEYHHLPGLPRTLHRILALLHRQGFEYLINSFDGITNPGSLPPFRLEPEQPVFSSDLCTGGPHPSAPINAIVFSREDS